MMADPTLPVACDDNLRRLAVADDASPVNGIDYLEVDPADQRILHVGFLHPLPPAADGVPTGGPALTADNVVVTGGVRVTDIEVVSVAVTGSELTVTVDRAGDFSPYVLRLVRSPVDDRTPDGYDPVLDAVEFSFKANCPATGDCRRPSPVAARPAATPMVTDYLVRDYEGFRRVMLDRLATLMPDRRDTNPADGLVTVVETLAHVADRLSYRLDAAGTEAYLGTARSRVSVRRHARLLDYRMHDGCTARAWLQVAVRAASQAEADGIPAGTPVFGGRASVVIHPDDAGAERRAGTIEFTTVGDLAPLAVRNEIDLHAWSGSRCRLPLGATAATLANEPPLGLGPGDLLLIEEVASPRTGRRVDADPAHRQVVRLTEVTPGHDPVEGMDVVDVRWDDSDALCFTAHITAQVDEGGEPVTCTVGRGNLVLAHHASPRATDLGTVPPGRWRPVLTDEPVACASDATTPPGATAGPASGVTDQDPRESVPMVTVTETGGAAGTATWEARPDLMGSDGFDRGFVLEIERDGIARLRFGDDTHGRAAPEGVSFTADWWAGGGAAGNVGRDVLVRMATDLDGVEGVTNPLPATGGADRESMEEARQYAPTAFATQERAVTTADWEMVAFRLPEVQHAAARLTWTGSWWTVFLTLDLRGGRRLAGDPQFEAELVDRLDRYRLAGHDLELRDPVDLPVDLHLSVCVDPDRVADAVAVAIREVLSSTTGFFHPDNFTFGQPLYLSDVVATVAEVTGVASVRVTEAHPVAATPGTEVGHGIIPAAALEIIRLDDDPSVPEHGTIHLTMEGGL